MNGARIDGATPLAGYMPGLVNLGGREILVTRGPKLTLPDPTCPYDELKQIIHGVLAADLQQVFYFEHWLRIAYSALRDSSPCVGQALAFAGPPECGKTLLQSIITQVLGGREGNPWPFMSGKTNFNQDFMLAEHLQFGDEIGVMTDGARRALASKIKGMVANPSQRLEAKGKDAVMVQPMWRLSISLNDEPEYLAVLPTLDESVKDKIMLFKASQPPFLRGTKWLGMSRTERLTLIRQQLPGYIAHLLSLPPIPDHLRNARTGIVSYHNPELIALMESVSSEAALLDLIDTLVFSDGSPELEASYWEGTGRELEALLHRNSAAGYDKAASVAIKGVLSYRHAAGTLLSRLACSSCQQRVTRKTVRGNHIYRVQAPRGFVPKAPCHVGPRYLRE